LFIASKAKSALVHLIRYTQEGHFQPSALVPYLVGAHSCAPLQMIFQGWICVSPEELSLLSIQVAGGEDYAMCFTHIRLIKAQMP
jgi:hypothetical protein